MFSLVEEVQDGSGTKIAWMSGFVWQKNNIINYQKYNEFWYGAQTSIIGKILPQLQKSKKFAQHKFVDTVKFIIDFLKIILAIYAFIDILELIFEQDKSDDSTQILIAIICTILILLLPLIVTFSAWKLKRKLKRLMQQLNLEWNTKGYQIRFPKVIKKWCLCLTCCSCFDNTNYQIIQIWENIKI